MTRTIGKAAIAATLLTAVGIALSRPAPRSIALADDLLAPRAYLEGAKTATWKSSVYKRFMDKDRRRSRWVRMKNQDHRFAFKAPGRYRREDLREGGHVGFIEIEDVADRAAFDLDPIAKVATIVHRAEPSYGRLGPFATIVETMKKDQLRSLGRRAIDGRDADGYRDSWFFEKAGQDWSYDFWIDPATKRLVEWRVPGGNIMALADVVSDMACDATAESIVIGGETFTVVPELGPYGSGSILRDVVEGPELPDSLFDLEPPRGYALKTIPLPEIREQDVVEFLGAVAGYFGGQFPDAMPNFHTGAAEYRRFEAIESDLIHNRPTKPAEGDLIRMMQRWWSKGLPGPGPLKMFLLEKIEDGSWKYLGRGVKLGDRDRIVCWYRPKGSRGYRVVYGDLSVKDGAEGDLPLPTGR